MSTALQIVDSETPDGLTARQVAIIKTQLAPGIDDASLMFFGATCARTGLDPVLRQIYIIGRKSKHQDERGKWETTTKWTIQVGIDGLQLIASRSKAWAGVDLPTFGPLDDEGHPEWAAVTVYRLVGGQRMPFSNIAYWAEYVQLKDEYVNNEKTGAKLPTDMWAKMPRSQLAKCARAGAIRMGFPAETSGIYATEEMGQADNEPPTPAHVVEARQQPAQRSPLRPAPKPASDGMPFATFLAELKVLKISPVEAMDRLGVKTLAGLDYPSALQELRGGEPRDLSELDVPGTRE